MKIRYKCPENIWASLQEESAYKKYLIPKVKFEVLLPPLYIIPQGKKEEMLNGEWELSLLLLGYGCTVVLNSIDELQKKIASSNSLNIFYSGFQKMLKIC